MKTIGVAYSTYIQGKGFPDDSPLHHPRALLDRDLRDPALDLVTQCIRGNVATRVGAIWPHTGGLNAHDSSDFERIVGAQFDALRCIVSPDDLSKKATELFMLGNNFALPFPVARPAGGAEILQTELGSREEMIGFHRRLAGLAARQNARLFYPHVTCMDEALAIAKALPPGGKPAWLGLVFNGHGSNEHGPNKEVVLCGDNAPFAEVINAVSRENPSIQMGLTYTTLQEMMHLFINRKFLPASRNLGFCFTYNHRDGVTSPWSVREQNPDLVSSISDTQALADPDSFLNLARLVNASRDLESHVGYAGWIVGANPTQVDGLARFFRQSTNPSGKAIDPSGYSAGQFSYIPPALPKKS